MTHQISQGDPQKGLGPDEASTKADAPPPSPFSVAGPRVHEQGFRPIPILPVVGTGSPGRGKAPGACEPINGSLVGVWEGMKGWQEWAGKDLPEEQVAHWATYPNANVGVLLDRTIGAVDIDVDDAEVQAAAMACLTGLGGEIVQKVGGKGFTVFFRQPDSGPIENASYSYADGVRAVDLLSMGRQTVIPPSEHVTGRQYRWLTPETLESVEASELPQVTDDFPEILREALRPLKIFKGNGSRKKARRKPLNGSKGEPIEVEVSAQTDYEREDRGWMSGVNVRAMRELEVWVPELNLYKCVKAGAGWRAVATWRPSATGRRSELRKRNLSISPQGIADFGDGGKGYTPIDLVMAAREISPFESADWLNGMLDHAAGVRLPDFGQTIAEKLTPAEIAGGRIVAGEDPGAEWIADFADRQLSRPGRAAFERRLNGYLKKVVVGIAAAPGDQFARALYRASKTLGSYVHYRAYGYPDAARVLWGRAVQVKDLNGSEREAAALALRAGLEAGRDRPRAFATTYSRKVRAA